MQNVIIYEQPLNERMRNLLRLEHLFSLIEFRNNELSDWDCRNILEALLEIIDLLSRSDLKTDLIKELERHFSMLGTLENNPGVDQSKLIEIKDQLSTLLVLLRNNDYQPGILLKQDELVSGFKQRISIPGGTCNFDLPRFHYWLNQPMNIRRQDIERWATDLKPISTATKTALEMLRNSTNPAREIAVSGFYQKPIESNLSCQLIRVILSADGIYYPEISGGKHRFTVRFMTASNTNERPVQTQDDVEFILHCCIL